MNAAVAVSMSLPKEPFLDYAVRDIPERLWRSIIQLPVNWLASSDFALRYVFPPAQRIWMKLDDTGGIQHAYYYSEDRCRVGKRISVHGPAEMELVEAQELLRRRGAARLDVQRMSVPNLIGAGVPRRGGRTASTIYAEDVVVEMPPTVEEMLMSLGHNKRQQLGKYTRRLEREWPGKIECLCLSKEQISEEIFRAVIKFNVQRQSEKGKQAAWKDAVVRQRWQLARQTGLLCGIRLAGEFVAGGVACLHGKDAYFLLIGHDPRYNYWNLGNLTTWLTMEKSLERGVRRFHFLWGISEYKLRFGGEVKPLYTVSVFRNYRVRVVSALLDSAPAWRRIVFGLARNARMMIRNSQVGRGISVLLHRLGRR